MLLDDYPVIGVMGRQQWDEQRGAAQHRLPLHGTTQCFFCGPYDRRYAPYVVSQIIAGNSHHATACVHHAAQAEVLCRRGVSIQRMADLSNLSHATVRQAVRGTTWRSVDRLEPPVPTGDFVPPPTPTKLTPITLRGIRSLRSLGLSCAAIAPIVGCSRSTVQRALHAMEVK